MKATTTFLTLFLWITLFCYSSIGFSQFSDVDWTITPSLTNDGSYVSGQQMEISFTVTNLIYVNANWVHGFSFDFPEGYDLSTVEVFDVPEGCDVGYWDWYDSVQPPGSDQSFGPGFFYETTVGSTTGQIDSLPGNNYGASCPSNWHFSFVITLIDSCVINNFPLDSNLQPTLFITSDGTSGNWFYSGPTLQHTYDGTMNFECCMSGYAGENARDVQYCEDEPTCLMDFITENLIVDSGGVWTGPDGWMSDEYCALFDPFSNNEGTYKYTVETEGCTRQSRVEISFNHLDNLEPFETCEPDIINLFDQICVVNDLPLNGTWFYPSYENYDSSVQVVEGLINPEIDDNGVYTYRFHDENLCFSIVKVNISMYHIFSSGVETWVDLCEDLDQFCPFEMLNGNPESGGQWIVTDAEGQYISFHTNYDVCFETSFFSDDIICSYIIGGNPCISYNTPLHINFLESSDCTESQVSLTGTYEEFTLSCEDQNMDLWVYEAGTSNQVSSTIAIFSDGSFSTLLDVPVATYDIHMKIDGFLSKAFENIDLGAVGTDLEIGTLIKGDVNNDDGINIIDVSILNSAFGSEVGDENFNPLSDLNCDGGINIVDLSVLNPGFNLSGDHTLLQTGN